MMKDNEKSKQSGSDDRAADQKARAAELYDRAADQNRRATELAGRAADQNRRATELAGRAAELYGRFCRRASKDDEFNDWKGYRNQLTEFIVKNTAPGASLLILGAGKCNDLDLKALAEHCGSITLSDYRPETAEEALRRYGLNTSEEMDTSDRLQLQEADYVGITDEDYIRYTARLMEVMEKLADRPGESPEGSEAGQGKNRDDQEGSGDDQEGSEDDQEGSGDDQEGSEDDQEGSGDDQAGSEADGRGGLVAIAGSGLSRLKEELERIYRNNETYKIDLGNRVFDNVAVAGVHSQLNNSFRGIFQYVRKDTEDRIGEIRFPEDLNRAIFEVTRKHTQALVRRFNKAVFSAASEGVIYGNEKRIIYIPECEKDPVIGTVDGARQAIEEVDGFEAADQLNCLWPLSKRRNIKFEMDIRYISAKNWR